MAQTALAKAHVGSLDEAFERLYREHVATVYRYALAVVRNPADAEDVAQSTFTNAYRSIRGGEWPTKPENWLIRIAHNECRQRFRRLGRRAVEVPLEEDVAEASSSEGRAETAEEIEEVLSALGELPFNQRAALVLREVSGRSAAEIAQLLGTSVSSVEMLIFRARRTLRTQYAGVRALALVPLPRSLLSFGGASTAAQAGAVAGGLGVAGKVAAVLVAGAVATGAGYSGFELKEHRDSPAAKPPVRASGPGEGVRGNQEVPATIHEAPAVEGPVSLPSALSPPAPTPPVAIPSVPSPPAGAPPVAAPPVPPPPVVQPPTVTPPTLPESPPPPAISVPSLPVEPPAVAVPPLLPDVPPPPVELPGP